MRFQSLSLASLGLLLLTSGQFVKADVPTSSNLAIIHGGTDTYASAFAAEGDEDDVEFELSEEYVETTSSLYKRADSCAKYHTVSGSDTCSKLAKKYGTTVENIYKWNSQIKKGCPNLHNGKKYCVRKSKKIVNKIAKKKTTKKKAKTTKKKAKKATKKKAKKSTKKQAKKSTKKAKSVGSSSNKEVRKKIQTQSDFTYYWIAQPEDYTGGKKVAVKTCSGETIGSVNENYADALVMEGTGIVGKNIVNLGGCTCTGYKCFLLIDKESDPYGLTSYGTPLRPYVTVASNDLKKNTKIYVPALVGWKLPGSNKVHNGCLLADDESWSFNGKHIDFYVYSMSNYEKLDKAHRVNHVDIYEGGSCQILNYL
ncbi:hypothetical protein BDB01DRAFT_898902 [Pilobolus umbonatus]|nr:hypothetical protein BDB01DRAFT_898902 [Pilobolus umbonatus]